MVRNNGAQFSTNFTMSIEAAKGVTTGISAQDRSQTIKVAVSSNSKPNQVVAPASSDVENSKSLQS